MTVFDWMLYAFKPLWDADAQLFTATSPDFSEVAKGRTWIDCRENAKDIIRKYHPEAEEDSPCKCR